jgi:hypothetical protein
VKLFGAYRRTCTMQRNARWRILQPRAHPHLLRNSAAERRRSSPAVGG